MNTELGSRYRSKTVLAICFTSLLYACVPTVETTLRPVASNGEILDGHCPPAPRTVVAFQRQGVLVSVRAYLGSNDVVDIRIEYEVPEGKVLKLVETYVTLLPPKNPPLMADLKTNQYSKPVISGKEIYGTTISSQLLESDGWPTLYSPKKGDVAKTIYKSYSTHAKLSATQFDSFSLILPRFIVNDVEIPPIQVTFAKEVTAYLGYFNC